jgi:hypothetical protein
MFLSRSGGSKHIFDLLKMFYFDTGSVGAWDTLIEL